MRDKEACRGRGPLRRLWLAEARTALRDLATSAKAKGKLDTLKDEIAHLNERLATDPTAVGELIRAKGDVEENVATTGLIWIDFALDRNKHVVAVRRCLATTRGGL